MELSTASWIALAIILVIVATMYFMLGSFLFGAGYQPTPPSVVRRMMAYAKIRAGDRVYDLGAGTGALLFRSVQEGAERAVGIEIEPIRFAFLKLRRRWSAQGKRVELRRTDLFRVDLREATVVLTFLWPGAMRKLAPKFERELPAGARVVSYWHPIPGWVPVESDPALRVYAYRVSSDGRSSSSAVAPVAGLAAPA